MGAKGAIKTPKTRARATPRSKLANGPELRELSPGRFNRVEPNIWGVRVGPDWLGPDTPRHVPLPVLKLMREDPQLSLGLAAYRGPFFGIDYYLEGGDPEVQAFVRRAFVDRPIFKKVLRSILNCVDFGFNAHELLWDIEDITGQGDEDSGLAPIEKAAAYVIREAKDIDPERVEILVDQHDRLAGYRVDGRIVIPAEKTLHVAHDMEYQRHRGRGQLKRSFNPWVWSSYLHQFQNRYMERKADPPYKGYAPAGARPDPKKPIGSPSVYPHDILRDILIDVRGSGVIILPSEFDPKTGKPLWDATEIGTGGRADLYLPTVQYYQTLKMRGLGIPDEVATTGDATGSYAKSAVSLNVFFDTLEALKEVTVLGALNEGIIRPLVRFNYGPTRSCPRIVAPAFSREHQDLLVDVLKMALADPENMAQLDIPKMFEIANLPKGRGRPRPVAGPGAGPRGRPAAPELSPTPTPMGTHSVAPSIPQAGPQAAASRVELASADSGPDVHVHITNQAPAAPNVSVTNRVPAAAAPTVHVTNQVPQAKAPTVNVEGSVVNVRPELRAPDVHVSVQPAASAPVARKDFVITRDARGEITGAVVKAEE